MLSIVGLVFIIVMTVIACRTAKDYERSAVGWGLLTFAVVFGIQIILPFFIGLVIGVGLLVSGTPQSRLQQRFDEDVPAVTISIVCMILSIIGGFLIIKYLAKVPEEKPFVAPPAPPTDFNQNN